MARVQLDVPAWDLITGTLTLSANDSSRVRAFNENDVAVSLPESIDPARLGTGPLNYYVEGLTQGNETLTLTLNQGTVTTDSVELVVGQQTGVRLTFDDGPDGSTDDPATSMTQQVLDAVATNSVRNGILATFFIQAYAPYRGDSTNGLVLLAEESSAGHHVEVHTGSDEDHIDHTIRCAEPAYDVDGDGTVTAADGQNALESDMIRAKTLILSVTGRTPLLVRPPYGDYDSCVLAVYSRQALSMTLWDVDSGDTTACATATDPTCLELKLTTDIQALIDGGSSEMTVLMHDIRPVTTANLKALIAAIYNAVQHRGRNVRFDQF
jgi:peptidoglycan/xylan/chitin deacetylase (PgdA/CDA1 family)